MEESSPAVSRSGSLPPGVGTPEESRPPPSPLSGAYLLVIISEPQTDAHKAIILQKLAKAFLSWNTEASGIDIERELAIVTALCPEGDFAKNGERLIQNASEHLVTEILIHPQVNTMRQCIRNLLSSFTKYRFIIHSGYAFCGNGSWILQDGTFSTSDFIDTFQEIEVQRVIRAYERTVKIDICCISEGTWNQSRINQEPFTKICQVEINPSDKISPGNVAVHEFVDYLERFVTPTSIQELLEPSDIVGNIRFTHPTLYVFPGGEGDAALFGINGFNMLVDGGFSRKACFWNFVRHLDRLDGVLLTRINNSNMGGMSGIVQRKVCSHVYPQIGHFFSNLQIKRNPPSADGDKDKEPLLVNLIDEGHKMVLNFKKLGLKPHHCYRDPNSEPINLYHKVGHGKLDMYVISPAKDSREVKEFLSRWNNYDMKLFSSTSKSGSRELRVPSQNLVSICALLVWQPANPEDHVTRILFPGSAPQHKIFEGFEKMKQLEFLKNSSCTMKSITPVSMSVLKKQKISSEIITDSLQKGDGKNILGENEVDAVQKPAIELKKPKPRKLIEKAVPKDKSEIKTATPKTVEKTADNGDVTISKMDEKRKVEVRKIVPKPPPEKKLKPPISLGATDRKSESEKSSPTTPKRTVTSTKVTSESIKDTTTKSTPEGLKSHIIKPANETKPITDTKDQVTKSTSRATKEQILTKEKILTKEPASIKEPIITKDHTLVKDHTSKASTETAKTVVRSTNKAHTPPKVFHAAKSLKDENNRKVAEAKKETRTRTPPKIMPVSKPMAPKKEEDISASKTEKKPIPIKRPRLPAAKATSTQSSAPVAVKKVLPIRPLKVDETKKNLKKDMERTDSSAVSTPSTIDADAVPSLAHGADSSEIKKVAHEITKTLAPTDNEQKQDTNITTYVSNIYRKEGHGLDDDDDEILVIETTEMKQIDNDEQKYLRDEKESEKKKEQESESDAKEKSINNRKLLKIDTDKNSIEKRDFTERKTPDSAVKKGVLTPEEKDKISDQVEGIITTATKLVNLKDSNIKSIEDDHQRLEAERDEKMAFESASTTTAPTMPEDEKADDVKQEIEEKYDKEETKEKSIEMKPELETMKKSQKLEETKKPVLKKDVKTPDEVADLPVDEETETNLQYEERDQLQALIGESTLMQPVTDIVELKHAEYVTITPTPVSSPDEKPSPLQESPDKNLKQKSSSTSPTTSQIPLKNLSDSLRPEVQLDISKISEDRGFKKEDVTKTSEPLVSAEVDSPTTESVEKKLSKSKMEAITSSRKSSLEEPPHVLSSSEELPDEQKILTEKLAEKVHGIDSEIESQNEILSPKISPLLDSASQSDLPSHTINNEREKIDTSKKLSITDTIGSDTHLPTVQSKSQSSPKDVTPITITDQEKLVSLGTTQIDESNEIIESKKKSEFEDSDGKKISTEENILSQHAEIISTSLPEQEPTPHKQELLEKISPINSEKRLVAHDNSEEVISPKSVTNEPNIGKHDIISTLTSSDEKVIISESLSLEKDSITRDMDDVDSTLPPKSIQKLSPVEKYDAATDSEKVSQENLDDRTIQSKLPDISHHEIQSDSIMKPEKDLSLEILPSKEEIKDRSATVSLENKDDCQSSQKSQRKDSHEQQLSAEMVPPTSFHDDILEGENSEQKESITELSSTRSEEIGISTKTSDTRLEIDEKILKSKEADSEKLTEAQRKYSLSKSTTEPILKDETHAFIQNKTHSLEEQLPSQLDERFPLKYETHQPHKTSNESYRTEDVMKESAINEDIIEQSQLHVELQPNQSNIRKGESEILDLHTDEKKLILEKDCKEEELVVEKPISMKEKPIELEIKAQSFSAAESLPYTDAEPKIERSQTEGSVLKSVPDEKSQASPKILEQLEPGFIENNLEEQKLTARETQENLSQEEIKSSKVSDKVSPLEFVENLSPIKCTNEIITFETQRKTSIPIDAEPGSLSGNSGDLNEEPLAEAGKPIDDKSKPPSSDSSPVLARRESNIEITQTKVDFVQDMTDYKHSISVSDTMTISHINIPNQETCEKQSSLIISSPEVDLRSSPDEELSKFSILTDRQTPEADISPSSVEYSKEKKEISHTDANDEDKKLSASLQSPTDKNQLELSSIQTGDTPENLQKSDASSPKSDTSDNSKKSPDNKSISILSRSENDEAEIKLDPHHKFIEEDSCDKNNAFHSASKKGKESPNSSISPESIEKQLPHELSIKEESIKMEVMFTEEKEVKTSADDMKLSLQKSGIDAQNERKKQSPPDTVILSPNSISDAVEAVPKDYQHAKDEVIITKNIEKQDAYQSIAKHDAEKVSEMKKIENVEDQKSDPVDYQYTQEKMKENLSDDVVTPFTTKSPVEEASKTEKDEKLLLSESNLNTFSTNDRINESQEKLLEDAKMSVDNVEKVPELKHGPELNVIETDLATKTENQKSDHQLKQQQALAHLIESEKKDLTKESYNDEVCISESSVLKQYSIEDSVEVMKDELESHTLQEVKEFKTEVSNKSMSPSASVSDDSTEEPTKIEKIPKLTSEPIVSGEKRKEESPVEEGRIDETKTNTFDLISSKEFSPEQSTIHKVSPQSDTVIDKLDTLGPNDSKMMIKTASGIKSPEENQSKYESTSPPEKFIDSQAADTSIQKQIETHDHQILEVSSPVKSQILSEISTEQKSHKKEHSNEVISDTEKLEENKIVNLQTVQEFIQEQTKVDENLIEKIIKSQRSSISDKKEVTSPAESQILKEVSTEIKSHEKEHSNEAISDTEKLKDNKIVNLQTVEEFIQEQTEIDENLIKGIIKSQRSSISDKIEITSPVKSQILKEVSTEMKIHEKEHLNEAIKDTEKLEESKIIYFQSVEESIQDQTEIDKNLIEKILKTERIDESDKSDRICPIDSKYLKDISSELKIPDEDYLKDSTSTREKFEQRETTDYQNAEELIRKQTPFFDDSPDKITKSQRSSNEIFSPVESQILQEVSTERKSHEKEYSNEAITDTEKLEENEVVILQTAKVFTQEQIVIDNNLKEINVASRRSSTNDKSGSISPTDSNLLKETALELKSTDEEYSRNIEKSRKSSVTDKQNVEKFIQEQSQQLHDDIKENLTISQRSSICDKIVTVETTDYEVLEDVSSTTEYLNEEHFGEAINDRIPVKSGSTDLPTPEEINRKSRDIQNESIENIIPPRSSNYKIETVSPTQTEKLKEMSPVIPSHSKVPCSSEKLSGTIESTHSIDSKELNKSDVKEISDEIISDGRKMEKSKTTDLQTAEELFREHTEIHDKMVDEFTKSQKGSNSTDIIQMKESKVGQSETELTEKEDTSNVDSEIKLKYINSLNSQTAEEFLHKQSEIHKDLEDSTSSSEKSNLDPNKIETKSPFNRQEFETTRQEIHEIIIDTQCTEKKEETAVSNLQTHMKCTDKQSESYDDLDIEKKKNPIGPEILEKSETDDESSGKYNIGELGNDGSLSEKLKKNENDFDKLKSDAVIPEKLRTASSESQSSPESFTQKRSGEDEIEEKLTKLNEGVIRSDKPIGYSYDSQVLKDFPSDHTPLRKKSFPDDKTYLQNNKTDQLTGLHRHTLTSIRPEGYSVDKSAEEITSELMLKNAAAVKALNKEDFDKVQVHRYSAEEVLTGEDEAINLTHSREQITSDTLPPNLNNLKEISTESEKLIEQLVHQKKTLLEETTVISKQETNLNEQTLQLDEKLTSDTGVTASYSPPTEIQKDTIQLLDTKKPESVGDKLVTGATSGVSTVDKLFDDSTGLDENSKIQNQRPQKGTVLPDENKGAKSSTSMITITEKSLSKEITNANQRDEVHLISQATISDSTTEEKSKVTTFAEKIETIESQDEITSTEFSKEEAGIVQEKTMEDTKSKTLDTSQSQSQQNKETDDKSEENIIEIVKDFIHQERMMSGIESDIKSDQIMVSKLADPMDNMEPLLTNDSRNKSLSKDIDITQTDMTSTNQKYVKQSSQKETSPEKQSNITTSETLMSKTHEIDHASQKSSQLSQLTNKSDFETSKKIIESTNEIISETGSSQEIKTIVSKPAECKKQEEIAQLTTTLLEKQCSSHKENEEKVEKIQNEASTFTKVTYLIDNDGSISKELLTELEKEEPKIESSIIYQTEINKNAPAERMAKEKSIKHISEATESPFGTFTTHIEETVTNIASEAIKKLDDTVNVEELIQEISDQTKSDNLEITTEYYTEKYYKEPSGKLTSDDDNAENQFCSTTYVTTTCSPITMDDTTYSTMAGIPKSEVTRDIGSNIETITTITTSSPTVRTSISSDRRGSQPRESIQADDSSLPVSPELQLDATQMRVKFTTDRKDDDNSRRYTLKCKSNSEEFIDSSSNTQDVVGDLSSKFEKREPVAKTVSLPIFDEKLENAKTSVEVEKSEDLSKSFPHLEKISNNEIRTSTNLSNPTLMKQVQGELQSKSFSLPVIKQPDDSEQFMTLPHLHKADILEDLTSSIVIKTTEESNIQEQKESNDNIATETTREESLIIGPIKETEEPAEDTYTFVKTIRTFIIDDESGDGETTITTTTHSGDRIIEDKSKVSSHDEKASSPQHGFVSQSFISPEKSASLSHVESEEKSKEAFISPGTTDISQMPTSMMQSFYGSYPEDDSDNDQEKSEVESDKKVSEGRRESSHSPKKDPIGDWGKPLGLPDERSMSTLLVWNPLEDWGRPLGLPSPTPTPVQNGQHRESNGDIEITLAPVNTKSTPKRTAKKPSEKNITARDTSKNRDSSAKKTKSSKQVNPIYVDLAYVPHHGNPYYTTVEFFKRIRARYYVFSGTDPNKDVFNALLEGKKSWENQDLEVTIISTYDTDVLGYWITDNEETLANLKIDLAPSASRCTINLQDHDTSCSAYRLEF